MEVQLGRLAAAAAATARNGRCGIGWSRIAAIAWARMIWPVIREGCALCSTDGGWERAKGLQRACSQRPLADRPRATAPSCFPGRTLAPLGSTKDCKARCFARLDDGLPG